MEKISGKIESEQAIEPLIQAFRDSDKNHRLSAIKSLGKIGGRQVIELLIQMLRDSDEDVRWEAVKVLRNIGGRQLIKRLIRAIRDSDGDILWRVEALGKIGGRQVIEPLMQVLQNSDKNTRQKAVEALRKIGSAQAIEPLIQTLQDSDEDIRLKGVDALGEIGNTQAIKPLIQAFQDSDWHVRQAARNRLQEIIPFIHTVFFTSDIPKIQHQKTIWYNPHVSRFMTGLPKLQAIVIDVRSCDIRSIERFITYAVNVIGQKPLKKHVTVYIYGDLTQKSPNTYNALNNLCSKVVVTSKNLVFDMLEVR